MTQESIKRPLIWNINRKFRERREDKKNLLLKETENEANTGGIECPKVSKYSTELIIKTELIGRKKSDGPTISNELNNNPRGVWASYQNWEEKRIKFKRKK